MNDTIKVIDVVNGHACSSKEDTQKVTKAIEETIARFGWVTLDFEGINVFSITFFNYSLGFYYLMFKPTLYKKKIKVINLDEIGQAAYNQCIKNVEENYLTKI